MPYDYEKTVRNLLVAGSMAGDSIITRNIINIYLYL